MTRDEARRAFEQLADRRRRAEARLERAQARLHRARVFVEAVEAARSRGADLRDPLQRVGELIERQQALDAKLAEASELQKEITAAVVPGMFYYLLTTAIGVTLCGFLILAYPEMRIAFIAAIAILFVGLLVFYLLRMQRYRTTTGALQKRLGDVAAEAAQMVQAIGEREEELRRSALPLETDSYVEYAPALAEIANGRFERVAKALGLEALEAEAAAAEAELTRARGEIEALVREHPEIAAATR
jgi:hypothetical protein